MKKISALAAPLAALALGATSLLIPEATAAELTPAAVGEGIAPAELMESSITAPPASQGTTTWQSLVLGGYDPRLEAIDAYSPSMDRRVKLVTIKAQNPDRPTLYLLNGGDGGEGRVNWLTKTNVVDFFLGKDVNVVIPMDGKFSYYMDWVEEAPSLGGKQMWETFLVKELPQAIEPYFQANNNRSIVGMSMSATSSLLLPALHTGFYDGAASFSGCAETNTPLGRTSAWFTLNRGGARPSQAFGATNSPEALARDALHNAEGLRGTTLYVSNGSGLAGEHDMPNGPSFGKYDSQGKARATYETVVEGGVIEGATNVCTHNLKTRLDELGIPATFSFANSGTHQWGYWREELAKAWPVLAGAMGIEP